MHDCALLPSSHTAPQPLYVNVTPTVIAARSNLHFNVSCGVENGQTLYNAEYQFFHNGVSISAPTRSSYTMVPANSTGNFTCNATQYSDQRMAIVSAPSLPVQAIVLGECCKNFTSQTNVQYRVIRKSVCTCCMETEYFIMLHFALYC